MMKQPVGDIEAGRGSAALAYPAIRLVIAMLWLGGWLFALIALHIKPVLRFEVVGSVVMLIAYLLYVRIVEKRAARELGLRGAPSEFGAGFLLGAALFVVTIGIIWMLGDYHITGVNQWTAILPPLAVALAAALLEEILFRGVIFRITEEWLGSWGALAISSLLFGGAHLANANASLTSALAIALEAGVLLGGAFMLTRRLWFPIGLHAAWNFTQSGIFGAAVSGSASHGLFASTLSGPTWATGGAFGPEASLPAVFVASFGVWLVIYAARTGRVVRPIWKRRAEDTGTPSL